MENPNRRGYFGNQVAKQIKRDEALEKEAKKREGMLKGEETYAKELHLAGRKAAFEEAFNGISLEEQNIKPIGLIEDPTKAKLFKEGYEQGIFLLNNGYTEEMYLTKFLPEYEEKCAKPKHR